jgi:hypothetical protein
MMLLHGDDFLELLLPLVSGYLILMCWVAVSFHLSQS